MATELRHKPKPADGQDGGPGEYAAGAASAPSVSQEYASVKPDDWPMILAHLHRGGQWAYWWTDAKKDTVWWPVGRPAEIPPSWRNVYFGVNPTAEKRTHGRARIPDVAAINCLFADLDAKSRADKPALLQFVDDLSPAPSVVVDSGGGFQCYWLLRDPYVLATDQEREHARDLLARWTAHVGGDPGAKDLARVLRVPGTRNYKEKYAPDFPPVKLIRADFSRLYALADLEALLPPAERRSVAGPTRTAGGGDGRDPGAEALFDRELVNLVRATEGERNTTLNRAAYVLGGLAEAGRLDEADKVPVLERAARGIGLGEREAAATIRSGLEAGRAKPLYRPATPAQAATARTDVARASQEQVGVDLLQFGPDDEGNAQAVVALYPDGFLHNESLGWLVWVGTHWERQGAEAALDRAIVETLKARRVAAVQAELEAIVNSTKPSAYRVRGCKYLLASILPCKVGDFDANPDVLNVLNGVVDLRIGELVPHDPRQRLTYVCPTHFKLDADQGEWLAFLHTAVGDRQDVLDYVQEAVGYSLTGHTREEVLFYLYGPARAGKGTFTETLLTALGGKPLGDEVDFGTFTADRSGDNQNFDLAGLKPCRVLFASESKKYSQLNAAKVKALTGGNEVRCAHKYGEFFSYRPQFKVWLASNYPVNADVDDDAIWYRVRVIRFPYCFAGREDKLLKERLREPGNLAGVLAWAVLGAMAWYGRGAHGLNAPDAVTVATREARDELDYVGQWLTECIEITGNPDDFVGNATLYRSYSTWCEENGVTAKHIRSLTQALKHHKVTTNAQKWVNSRNQKGCEGLRMLTITELTEDPVNFPM